MKNVKLILAIIIVSSFFLGCVKPPAGTPAPTATPTAIETVKPTVIITPSPTPTPTPVRESAVYKTDVDNYYGFYRVIETVTRKPLEYENKTLNIYAGDTMVWINDADNPEESLTIVSEQNLWNRTDINSILRWRFKQFNYTFTQPGTYTFYIKEYPRIQHQKIIVKP